jgi:hypothetical protein
MAQFSVKIMRLIGSVLGENQHPPIWFNKIPTIKGLIVSLGVV